ncbi:Uncharacterized protein FKW44_008231 [Caligus rogercresseyi]|uniref:Helicase ATP-binding domain-containing protein n=1 Tax=Caligus rogercresseyi TaxID=217165 RepID=A0A7T8KFT7_CALRO|nr:Uncharacterized protein FKW44_008231 [Caligus rogercresseyi]
MKRKRKKKKKRKKLKDELEVLKEVPSSSEESEEEKEARILYRISQLKKESLWFTFEPKKRLDPSLKRPKTEKFSKVLAESLAAGTRSKEEEEEKKEDGRDSTEKNEKEYRPDSCSEDDEETMALDEENHGQDDEEEINKLQKESEIPIEELLQKYYPDQEGFQVSTYWKHPCHHNRQDPVPFILKHTLREYQHIGLDWLVTLQERKLNGILADEMGLGKTIQTIAFLAHMACEKQMWGPHLIVVPTSVLLNWEMEIKKWAPAFKVLTYYGSQKERRLKRTGWTKPHAFHICITSYKLVIQDHSSFRRKKWHYSSWTRRST